MSIHLTTGQANSITVTLYEADAQEYDYYLFVFDNDQSLTQYTVIAPADTSTNPVRWNTFSITEGVDDRINGSVILGNPGYYQYSVYGQASSTNLDPTLADSLLEIGKMRLDNGINDTFTKNTDTGGGFTVNNSEV